MIRTVLVKDGRVRCYLLTEGPPTEAEKAQRAWGDDWETLRLLPDGSGWRDLATEGEWVTVPPAAGLVGDDWTYDGKAFAAPPPPAPDPTAAARTAALAKVAQAAGLTAAEAEALLPEG